MAKEFETKVLDIDVDEIVEKLERLGAERESEVLMKRWVFDIDPSKDEWIRLRDDGNKVTFTYKCKQGSGISDTEEIEVEVHDFQKTSQILSKLDFKDKIYQESKRTSFRFKGIEFNIDSWPRIPSYLEIEAISEEEVKRGLAMLDLRDKDVGNLSVVNVYCKYNLDLHSIKSLKF